MSYIIGLDGKTYLQLLLVLCFSISMLIAGKSCIPVVPGNSLVIPGFSISGTHKISAYHHHKAFD